MSNLFKEGDLLWTFRFEEDYISTQPLIFLNYGDFNYQTESKSFQNLNVLTAEGKTTATFSVLVEPSCEDLINSAYIKLDKLINFLYMCNIETQDLCGQKITAYYIRKLLTKIEHSNMNIEKVFKNHY